MVSRIEGSSVYTQSAYGLNTDHSEEGLANIMFQMYCEAAIIGMSVSRNERNQTDATKTLYRRDSGLSIDKMRGGGSADLYTSIAAVLGQFGSFLGSTELDKKFLSKVADQIPNFLTPYKQGYQLASQEAGNRMNLSHSELTNAPQGASTFRNAVEEIAKNLCEQANRLNAEAARNMGG